MAKIRDSVIRIHRKTKNKGLGRQQEDKEGTVCKVAGRGSSGTHTQTDGQDFIQDG